MTRLPLLFVLLLSGLFFACAPEKKYDLLIRNGLIYDGSGTTPYRGDIGIIADTIAFIGTASVADADTVIDAEGYAVSPGFINMLSWAGESLIIDGRSQGDILQGVTLEVLGEGWSMGPLNDRLKTALKDEQAHMQYDVNWSTLGEYLKMLEKKGVSTNIASFVGATTIRQYVIGEDDRKPTLAELDSMRMLVRQAMEEGALGVSTSLIYPPGFFASTEELIELSKEAARYNGMYISHMRNEGNNLLEAVDELFRISREAGIRAEIFHLKAAGKNNWWKIDSIIARVEQARAEGLPVSANMYLYTAGSTGLTAGLPPSLQNGGFGELWKRLQDPVIRQQMKAAMRSNPNDWDNLYYASGSAENVLLLGFRTDSLRKYIGMNLARVAALRGADPETTALNLIVQDSSSISVAFDMMSEENVRKQLQLPWMSFGSDAGSYSPEGIFLKASTHPRAYGNFARLISNYVVKEKRMSLEETIRKLTSMPAENLKITQRGRLKPGYFADILVFKPEEIKDNATFDKPHQLAEGMQHVFVNGRQVVKAGKHTGALPGRVVKGPGAK